MGKENECVACGKVYPHSQSLRRHQRQNGCLATAQPGDFMLVYPPRPQPPAAVVPKVIQCTTCGQIFAHTQSLNKHRNLGRCHALPGSFTQSPRPPPAIPAAIKCITCGQIFAHTQSLNKHHRLARCPGKPGTVQQLSDVTNTIPAHNQTSAHSQLRSSQTGGHLNHLPPRPLPPGVKNATTSKSKLIATYHLINTGEYSEIGEYLRSREPDLVQLLQEHLKTMNAIKANIFLECTHVNMHGETKDTNFKTDNNPINHSTDIPELMQEFTREVVTEAEEHASKKSGWTLHEVKILQLRISKLESMAGSSFLLLPIVITNTKAVVNPRNPDDNMCFKWAVLVPHHRGDHPEIINNLRNYEHMYDFSMVKFPAEMNDIKKFERANNITINVFCLCQDKKVYPYKVVKKELPNHRDLLLVEFEGNRHYACIMNFARLVRHQITKRNGAVFMCKNCYGHKYSQEDLEEHKILCDKHKPQIVEMPLSKVEGGEVVPPFLTFTARNKQQRVPVVIYADFESILYGIHGPPTAAQADPNVSSTRAYQNHEAMSVSCYIKSTLPPEMLRGIQNPFLYRGDGAPAKLVAWLRTVVTRIKEIYLEKKPMLPLNPQQQVAHDGAKECYICNEPFKAGSSVKVRDHCHITGHYRGPAHADCNLQYQNPDFVPVFFHNLSGYDAHFIVHELGYDEELISVIANNSERYITFSKRVGAIKMQFVDTFRFLPHSLDQLAKDLPRERFHTVREVFSAEPVETQELLMQKGAFPYDFVDGKQKLELEHLPDKKHFYSVLNECEISDTDYARAEKVWSAMRCKTLGEYSDVYLLGDVCQLADVFENFRVSTLKNHGLDPAWYITCPSLAWDAALKHTRVTLELLTDPDMALMIESGIRGGITQVVERYCEAKEPADGEIGVSINYWDANNLYGAAMCGDLPYRGFEWMNPDNFQDFMFISLKGIYGLILMVDVEYPEHLHDAHNDLPFLCEKQVPPGGKNEKLLCTLHNKTNYVVHLSALQQAVSHGLKVTKIHRVLRFEQKAWLKPYIEHNNVLRQKADNKAEQDHCKLLNNAVYGKSLQNVRNYIDLELVNNDERLRKLIGDPRFEDRTELGNNLVAVQRTKRVVVLNRPLYVGMVILDLSKTIMYEFYYDKLKVVFGPRVRILYMDTDSFILAILTHDIFKEMREHLDWFDTSNFPKDNVAYSDANRKVLGKFKDEVGGKKIKCFVGLRAKMYALLLEFDEYLKAKGIKRSALLLKVVFEHYVRVLREKETTMISFNRIRSKNHRVSTVEQHKVALNGYDDKRRQKHDSYQTLAWGHYGCDMEDLLDLIDEDVEME